MVQDREREREREGKKEGAIAVSAELTEEAVPCGLCGDPLIEGEVGDREPRGGFHFGCIRKARREVLGQAGWESFKYRVPRRQKRRG